MDSNNWKHELKQMMDKVQEQSTLSLGKIHQHFKAEGISFDQKFREMVREMMKLRCSFVFLYFQLFSTCPNCRFCWRTKIKFMLFTIVVNVFFRLELSFKEIDLNQWDSGQASDDDNNDESNTSTESGYSWHAFYRCSKCGTSYKKMNMNTGEKQPCKVATCGKMNAPYHEVSCVFK